MTLDPLVHSVNVVVLFVQDTARSQAFYRDILGLTVVHEDENSVFIRLDNMAILLLSHAGAEDLLTPDVVAQRTGSRFQLTSFVADVDALAEHLREQGVRFIRGPEDRVWGMRVLSFLDPDGHVWEFAQDVARAT